MITMELRPFSDPAMLAASVREVALQARRILNDPSQSALELMTLSRRIDRIRASVPGSAANPLARWLENLSHEVDNERRGRGPKTRLAQSVPAR